MANHPEALAQLARLLSDERLVGATPDEVRSAIETGFERLIDGLVAEASASDDVSDRDSALYYVEDRLRFLSPMIGEQQRQRLRQAIQERIASW